MKNQKELSNLLKDWGVENTQSDFVSEMLFKNHDNIFGTPHKRDEISVEDIVRVMTDTYATCDDSECIYCSICAHKTAQAIHDLLKKG